MEETPALPTAAAAAAVSENANHCYWTLAEKVDLCIEAERVVNASKMKSLCKFCRKKEDEDGRNLQPKQIRTWTKQLGSMHLTLQDTKKREPSLPVRRDRSFASTNGRKS